MRVFIYCALFTVQKYNKKMTYANLYAIFLQFYQLLREIKNIFAIIFLYLFLYPAAFLFSFMYHLARTLAYLIYIRANPNAIFKTIFTKICIIQKNVVPLRPQRLRYTPWAIKSRYIFSPSAWRHIRCVTACPVMMPLPFLIGKGWRPILPNIMTCCIRKGKTGLLMILTNLFKIANETLSRK